jgi:PKD repeat protein
MKIFTIIFVILLIMVSMIIVPSPVNALNYSMDTDLSNVDASFIGEEAIDRAGYSVAGAGDVNGDGYDDILIGAYLNDDGGDAAGHTYLVLGKSSGWTMDIDLSNADASFIGEDKWDRSGESVASAGDVNGDGYDDILIGTPYNDDGENAAGQTYLILGKSSGWTMDNNLSNVDASFIGEDKFDNSGYSVAGAGDVNGDGYDDILIGAYHDEEGGEYAGQTYLILGKATGWTMDTDLSKADASFIGEDADDRSGNSVAGAGDINGDNYDDILIGAPWDEAGGSKAGQTYLIFGKASGWTMDTDLSNADASFIGENADDRSGNSVVGAGDINGDGYDDILIGAHYDDDGGNDAGQTYLILGNASGWVMDTDLANADASFIGENGGDYSGWSVSGVGDVNGDGYDDILIGDYGDDDGGSSAGQTYLILGKASGWVMDTDLSKADASFIGEYKDDYSGWSVAAADDVNSDGYDDILIGAFVDYSGPKEGETYLIFLDANSKPSAISSVKAYSDDIFSIEVSKANVNDTIYIELVGTDGNSSRSDIAIVTVKSSNSSPIGYNLRLFESGLNTGKYRGNFTIKNRTHDNYHWIKASIGEIITISSIQDPSKNATILLGEMNLYPKVDNYTTQEDEEYNAHYSTVELYNINWDFETNASWLEWNETSHNVSGIPNNADVGSYWVRINITKSPNLFDEHNFTLVVINTPPNIISENIITTIQNQKYSVDYDSSDDGQGLITWHLFSNASWLQIDSINGNLTGIPSNTDVGSFWVNVSVDDGNGGWDFSNFTLYVRSGSSNNTAPIANAGPDHNVEVSQIVIFDGYKSYDPDGDALIYKWSFGDNTSTKWLSSSKTSHSYNHPGNYKVTLIVSDGLLTDNDTCTILVSGTGNGINSAPVAVAGPDHHVKINQTVNFDGGGSFDPDGDELVYKWDFGDGTTTGWLNSSKTSHSYQSLGNYTSIITVSDGLLTANDTCKIRVSETGSGNNSAPVAVAGPNQHVIVNQTVNFDGNQSFDAEADKLSFKWDFGDNTYTEWLTVGKISHSYNNSGNYTATLAVSDGSLLDRDTCIIYVSKQQQHQNSSSPKIISSSIKQNSQNISINLSKIEIEFSTSMNRSSVESALSITPLINYTLLWGNNDSKLQIIFKEKLLYNTSYKITISSSAKDLEERYLKDPFKLEFITEIEHQNRVNGNGVDILENLNSLWIITILLIIIILILSFILKNRKKIEKKNNEDIEESSGRQELSENNLTEDFYFDENLTVFSTEYSTKPIKELKKESHSLKKPSDFKLSNDKLMRKLDKQNRKSQLSKTTNESKKETL